MKITILVKIARQVEGEMIFINVERATKDENVIREYLKENKLSHAETIQGTNCVVEYGVITDIEIEE